MKDRTYIGIKEQARTKKLIRLLFVLNALAFVVSNFVTYEMAIPPTQVTRDPQLTWCMSAIKSYENMRMDLEAELKKAKKPAATTESPQAPPN